MLDEDGVGHFIAAGDLHVVADAAFEGDVGDEAAHVLGIDARGIAGIRVAVGVAVLAVEKEKEFVAIPDGLTHDSVSWEVSWVSGVVSVVSVAAAFVRVRSWAICW